MKIRNYLTIFFATIAIFFLLGLAGYLTYLNADDANPVKQAVASVIPGLSVSTEKETEADTSPSTEAVTVTEETPVSTASSDHSVIFVGDSRTVSMQEAVGDACIYIGKDGEGYRWFASDGVTALTAALENDPTQTVVYNLGVNDPENANLYVELYSSIASQYTDTPFYYLSVNPLSDEADCNTTNEMIQEFNQTIKNAFPDHYLDCYDYLMEHGFDTVDGLHYTEATSNVIHDYVIDQVKASA